MKTLFLTLLFTSSAFAQTSPITVKERLRYHLWTQGLSGSVPMKTKQKVLLIHPEELERPLRKYF